MKKMLLIILTIICLLPFDSFACTALSLDNGTAPIVCKNYDWNEGAGLIIVNKRNVKKRGVIQLPEGEPILYWSSKFASVTFNNFSREMAFGGMNEAGLVVESVGTPKDKDGSPTPDSRPMIYPLQWAQYQLDNYSTIEEVINSDSLMRMPPPVSNQGNNIDLHFFVCDSAGNSLVVEFLDGKTVYHSKDTLPYRILSNNTYEKCISTMKVYDEFGGFLPIGLSEKLKGFFGLTPTMNAFPRFALGAYLLEEKKGSSVSVNDAFYILESLRQPKHSTAPTQWSIVYDIKSRTIYFKTKDNDKIRFLNFSSFDFSCKAPVTVFDVNSGLEGDVSSCFVEYTSDMNRELILSWAPNVPENIIALFQDFIESLECSE